MRLGPVGVRRLREYLGAGEVYRQFQERFDAADLAWFVAGAHKDGTHFLYPDQFHKAWGSARMVEANGTEDAYAARRAFRDWLRNLVWDTVSNMLPSVHYFSDIQKLTMLDRINGGASFLVHSPGTVEPGHRDELPYLKLDVYFPPYVIQENPLVDRALASMVQTFAEEIALPVTRRWRRAFANTGHSLPARDSASPIDPPSNLPLMPEPQRKSTMYRYRGRRVGELEEMLANTDDSPPTDRDGPARRDGNPGRSGQQRQSTEEAESLRAEIARLEAIIADKDTQISHLGEIVEDKDRDIMRLEEELAEALREGKLPFATPLRIAV